DVLAMVALGVREAEEALLEDRILAVPERQREADPLVAVRDAQDPVLVPPVGPRAGVVMREVVPGRSVFAVVLAHGAPGPRREEGSPAIPARFTRVVFGDPPAFGGLGLLQA